MLRIPSTGVMLDADDLATVGMLLHLAEAACQTTLGGDPHLSSIRGRAAVWGTPTPTEDDPYPFEGDYEQRQARASLDRLRTFRATLEAARR